MSITRRVDAATAASLKGQGYTCRGGQDFAERGGGGFANYSGYGGFTGSAPAATTQSFAGSGVEENATMMMGRIRAVPLMRGRF